MLFDIIKMHAVGFQKKNCISIFPSIKHKGKMIAVFHNLSVVGAMGVRTDRFLGYII